MFSHNNVRSATPDTDTGSESPVMYIKTEEETPDVASNPPSSSPSTHCTCQVDLNGHKVSHPVSFACKPPNSSTSGTPEKQLTPLQVRIASYRILSGFVPYLVPTSKNNRSITYDYGVRMLGVGRNNAIDKWHCLATRKCNTDILVVKNTSNITNHLKRVHNMTSVRSDKIMNKRTQTKTKYNRAAQYLKKFMHDPAELNRMHELNLVKLIVHKYLPFCVAEDEQFRFFCNGLDINGHFNNRMTNKNVKHRLVEMYVTTGDLIMEELKEAMQDVPIPKFHLNINFWTSKVSHQKYCGLRLFFVDENWQLRSAMLGIRLFTEDTSVAKARLSDRLLQWTKDILSEFEIDHDFIFSATSDAGSDLKRLCSVLLPSNWDWCVPHLTNCALVDAFGTSLQASSSKNREFRCLLKQVKKLIEHINRSSEMRVRFGDLQFEQRGTRLRCIRDMPHRWLGTIRLIERFLSLWETIRLHYVLHEKVPFPVDHHKDQLIECFSLMKPFGDLIRMSQATNYPAGIDAFLELCSLKGTVLVVLVGFTRCASQHQPTATSDLVVQVPCLQGKSSVVA